MMSIALAWQCRQRRGADRFGADDEVGPGKAGHAEQRLGLGALGLGGDWQGEADVAWRG